MKGPLTSCIGAEGPGGGGPLGAGSVHGRELQGHRKGLGGGNGVGEVPTAESCVHLNQTDLERKSPIDIYIYFPPSLQHFFRSWARAFSEACSYF